MIFRHPFRSQFRSGLNHTLRDYLGRLRTVGGIGLLLWMVFQQLSFPLLGLVPDRAGLLAGGEVAAAIFSIITALGVFVVQGWTGDMTAGVEWSGPTMTVWRRSLITITATRSGDGQGRRGDGGTIREYRKRSLWFLRSQHLAFIGRTNPALANRFVRRCRKHAVEQPWNGSRLRIRLSARANSRRHDGHQGRSDASTPM